MRFALFGNTCESCKSVHAEQLFSTLSGYGDEVYVDREFYHFLCKAQSFAFKPAGIIENLEKLDIDIDMAISLGGDGTFLKAARCVGATDIPIVGINTGRLGFLADVSPNEMERFFAQLHEGHYTIRKRSLLEIIVGDDVEHPSYALNEITVSKHDSSSMIAVHTTVGNEHLATYMGDGLIIATPTGSTAYSLSAGGPIIYPQADVFVLTAVAPHSLGVRPIIIADDKTINLNIESRSGSFLVAIDGISQSYPESATLTLRKAKHTIRVVKKEGNTFFHTLHEKMMWGADPRE
jgi:NAD+ kinase